MAPNPNLQRLREAGVSIWLDTLSRELLDSGGFAELIRDYPLPVYALGGLQHVDLETAWNAGAHGISMMRGAWPGA